jgi:hypothetical protein
VRDVCAAHADVWGAHCADKGDAAQFRCRQGVRKDEGGGAAAGYALNIIH